jgi:hypothetical protein
MGFESSGRCGWVCVARLAIFVAIANVHADADARQSVHSFKVAFYNIQSGKGQPGLPGHVTPFASTMNCTDPTLPLNAWGVGFVQEHLRAALADSSTVALGLAEAWFCGSPSNVRQALGWKANTTERNGTALVARYGFAGAEEWIQLDTSLNLNPKDTMWVLRIPVCLDSSCSASINVFTTHWYAEAAATIPMSTVRESYDRQAAQTVAFLQRSSGVPHALIGDLNTWEGTLRVCNEDPTNAGLNRLRDAGYVDAWPLVHGGAEGFTGMVNRPGCGVPEGYVWKRPDYVWSPANFTPLSIARFGTVPPGDAAPSDHYGLLAEFPWPGSSVAPPPPAPIAPAPAEVVLHARSASVVSGSWRVVDDATAAGGARLWNPDAGAPKLTAAASAPAGYFELSFTAEAGRPYRLWLRGQAEANSWTNDSVFVQFNGSVDQYGTPAFRIGTSGATVVSIEEGSGMGLSGWGWQDNGYDSLGPLVYFASTGTQTIRIQQREDGVSIDQILLSPAAFLQVAPGASKNDTTIYASSSAGSAANAGSTAEIVLYAASALSIAGAWRRESDSTAAGGARLWNPNAGAPKSTTAASAPTSYFELPFTAEAGRPYRLWLRGKAEANSYTNDSVFVQFSGSVTQNTHVSHWHVRRDGRVDRGGLRKGPVRMGLAGQRL